jgi:hypothetical protein
MSVPTTTQECGARLDAFINSLPQSTVKFFFFTESDLVNPKIASNLSEWKIGNTPCFITKGSSPSWSYTYTASSLKALFLNSSTQTETDAYAGRELHPPLQAGGHGGEVIEQGDHVTIGTLKYRGDSNLYMETHKTFYEDPGLDATHTWHRKTIDCKIVMTGNIQDSDACYEYKIAPKFWDTFAHKYRAEPFTMEIIKAMEKVYCGTYKASGGMKEYVKYKGHRYLVRTGKQGGRYIQLRDGTKVYNPKMQNVHSTQSGGHEPIEYEGTRFSLEFVQFLCTYVIAPVKDARSDLEGIYILYDELSYFGNSSNRQIVIIYDFRWPNTSVFYLDALKALTAYYASQKGEAATDFEKTTFNTFKVEVEPVRQIRVH